MGRFFNASLEGNVLSVGFGEAADNDAIVADAAETLKSIAFGGSPLLKVTGRASLPVAMSVAHAVCHLYGAVACYDPKLGKYVVAISHTPEFKVGQLVD